MKYLTAILALLLVSCAAVEFAPRKQLQARPYPAVGSLFRNGWSRCTLVLIDECVVLTAAHCVDDPGTYTVGLGFDRYEVTDITINPDWKRDIWEADLALLTLATSPHITPIPIARTPVVLDDIFTPVTIVGRGLPLLRWEHRWILGKLEGTDLILWPDPKNWIMNGDSGGPMLWDDCVGGVTGGMIWDDIRKPQWQVGISTDVGLYTEWIDEYLGESSPSGL